MDALTIVIRESSEGGYLFDIYPAEPDCPMENSADGGLCTTTLANALSMATSQAADLIARTAPDPLDQTFCKKCEEPAIITDVIDGYCGNCLA